MLVQKRWYSFAFGEWNVKLTPSLSLTCPESNMASMNCVMVNFIANKYSRSRWTFCQVAIKWITYIFSLRLFYLLCKTFSWLYPFTKVRYIHIQMIEFITFLWCVWLRIQHPPWFHLRKGWQMYQSLIPFVRYFCHKIFCYCVLSFCALKQQ